MSGRRQRASRVWGAPRILRRSYALRQMPTWGCERRLGYLDGVVRSSPHSGRNEATGVSQPPLALAEVSRGQAQTSPPSFGRSILGPGRPHGRSPSPATWMGSPCEAALRRSWPDRPAR